MARYLLTHSLLASWLYALKDSPYEDATTERDPFAEFLTVLRREPTPVNEAIANGISFENLVTAVLTGAKTFHVIYHNDKTKEHRGYDIPPAESSWFDAAQEIAEVVRGGVLQCKSSKALEVAGLPFLLYGRLDVLKAGTVYDIKFSKNYERGKYFNSTQHPVYLELIPQADKFVYLISNGSSVWTETYRRDETADIRDTIAAFIEWLKRTELFETYQRFWRAK